MATKKKNKNEEILHEMYRMAFAASTPYGDFDELMRTSPKDEDGRILIPFMDYECTQEKLDDIFESTMKKYKVNSNYRKAFSFNFWLGCSPKTARNL